MLKSEFGLDIDISLFISCANKNYKDTVTREFQMHELNICIVYNNIQRS